MSDPVPSLDRVWLRGLVVEALVGIHPEERDATQPIEIDLELGADLGRACASDRIEDTVDYERVEERVREVVAASRCYLLEALAQKLADVVLSEPVVREVRIRIRKVGPRSAGRTGVELVRSRPA